MLKIRNPKLETRNKSKIQMRKEPEFLRVGEALFRNFPIFHCFEFRHSDFGFPGAPPRREVCLHAVGKPLRSPAHRFLPPSP